MLHKYSFWIIIGLFAAFVLRIWQIQQYPVGLHYDLAGNVVLMDEIAQGQSHPIFITAYTGREVLFFYLGAGLFWFLGASVFAMRLTGIFCGVLTVAATFFAVRQLFWQEPKRDWLATLSGLALATCFAHIVFSRFGFRVITMPLVTALAVGFLARYLRTRSWQSALGAGVLCGLAGYTYLAVRLFPLVIAGFWLLVFWMKTPSAGRGYRQKPVWWAFVIFALAAGLVFSPLGWFFYQHPSAFFTRINQVAPQGEQFKALWQAIPSAIGMIFWRGEWYFRYNQPHLPLLNPLEAALAMLGLIAVWRARLPAPSKLLLAMWMPLFLLPTLLAVNEIFPSTIRAFGLFPLLMAFPALGMVRLLERLGEKYPMKNLLPLAMFICLVGGASWSAGWYFGRWAVMPEQYLANDADLLATSDWLNQQTLDEQAPIIISALHFQHPTLAASARAYPAMRFSIAGQALPLPASGAAYYLFPQSAPPPSDWLAGWQNALLAQPLDPRGQVDFSAYYFADVSQMPLPDLQPLQGQWAGQLQALGMRVAETSEAFVNVDVLVQVLAMPAQDDLRLVVEWIDRWGNRWGQGYNTAYPVSQWQVGDRLLLRAAVPVPLSAPPGVYQPAISFYSPSQQVTLPFTTPSGQTAAYLQEPTFQWAGYTQFEPLQPALHNFAGLELRAFSLERNELRAGDWLPLRLEWQARTPLPAITYRLQWGEFTLVEQAPVMDSFPTNQWTAGQTVSDIYHARLPRNLPAETHPLILQALDEFGSPLTSVSLADLTIRQRESQTLAVPPQIAVSTTFAQTFQLLGYDLKEESGQWQVTLHWQALQTTDIDYTFFIHVRNPDGFVTAQRDSQPVTGSLPTGLWRAGEFVQDVYTFESLPSTEYQLVVGWYLPATGERLLTETGANEFRIK
ncbi:MAG TPA: hypothetical protein PK299_03100 [Anaerolineales bacterium]|nr:hypothetical protein [Anaerolineales bacterium]